MAYNPKIFRVNTSHRLIKKETDGRQLLLTIIRQYQLKNDETDNVTENNISSFKRDNVEYLLYSFNTDEITSKWHSFLPTELVVDNNFKEQKVSIILLAKCEINTYVILGGSSFQVVLPFIDKTFGLNVYARILSTSQDQLQSVRSKGITGRILGSSEQYRDDYRLIDYIKFGTIPKELIVQLSNETFTTYFNFLRKKKTDKLIIEASSSFKIKKDANFEELHQIVSELEIIHQLAPSDFLSSFKEIDEPDLIANNLNTDLISKLFGDIDNAIGKRSAAEIGFQHDFCNPNNFEMFYSADEYKLKEKVDSRYSEFDTVSDRRDIYSRVMRRVKERGFDQKLFDFEKYIRGVRITCHRDNTMLPGSGCSFIYHISTEISLNGKSYFYIDNKWYEIRNSFVNELKLRCEEILRNNLLGGAILTELWNRSQITERDYNMAYNQLDGYIVVDRTIVDNVELCDIIAFDSTNIYLIHVKYGFNAKMRELTNQVLVSAKQLQADLKQGGKQMLKKLYKRLNESTEVRCEMEEDDFLKLFDLNKKFVLAFASQRGKDELVIDNIDLYDSNIARFSVVQCSTEMRTNYYPLFFHQIRKVQQ